MHTDEKSESEKLREVLERIRTRTERTGNTIPWHDRDLRDDKNEYDHIPNKLGSDHLMFQACFAELTKTAGKIVRETSLAMTRSGKRPISVQKFLQKLDKGELGWKLATKSGDGDPTQEWPPTKPLPQNAVAGVDKVDTARVSRQTFTFPVLSR
jgi:hypothetical protein